MGETWILIRFDPGFYAVLTTVMQFCQYCHPIVAYEVLDLLVAQPPQRYVPGPCGVFLSRLYQLGWRWEGNGYLLDHQSIALHIRDTPIQWLRQRLEHAWGIMGCIGRSPARIEG